ncbi:MAG: NfeD family protein [Eubacterium sp.]|nr:NfeD family protein [Eubacterium sp.]
MIINGGLSCISIRLRDVEWIAKSEDGSVIPEGEMVDIKKIDGVKLIVAKR